jgi:hypothetical protein
MLLLKTHAAVIHYVEEHVNKDLPGTRHQQLDENAGDERVVTSEIAIWNHE